MADRAWDARRQARARRILKRAVARPPAAAPAGGAVGAAGALGAREFLLPLRAGEELTVAGAVEVRIARGALEVWGARLGPSAEFHRVSAAPWAALPRLRALASEAPDAPGEGADVGAFLAARQWPAVVVARVAFAAPAEPADGEDDERPARQALAAAFAPGEAPPRLRAHAVWPALAERLADFAPAGRPPIVLVMGAKGVGKSTCCRWFANALFSSAGEACFLETDLGQPELTTPGLVSLHRLRRPLLHGAPTVQHDHGKVAGFFAGGVTPATHPLLYIRCVRAAFEAYLELGRGRADGRPPPLVVNTHGWVTGFGLELVQAILGIVGAQLVIRIRSGVAAEDAASDSGPSSSGSPTKRKRNMLARSGPLAQGLLDAACAPAPGMPGSASGGVEGSAAPGATASTSAVLVDTCPVGVHAAGAAAKRAPFAADARWLRFACHFRGDLDPCAPPAGMPARDFFGPLPRLRLPLRRLRFGLVRGGLAASEVEAAFTGTVVALCSFAADGPPDAVPREGAVAGSGPDAAPVRTLELGDAAPRCAAMAFVHAFDLSRQELVVYVAAPSAAEVEGVTAVLRGEIAWEPHSVRGQLVAAGPASAGATAVSPLQPYCSAWMLEGLAAGARATTVRGGLKRKLQPPGAGAAARVGA